jgi:hypothetical protein
MTVNTPAKLQDYAKHRGLPTLGIGEPGLS